MWHRRSGEQRSLYLRALTLARFLVGDEMMAAVIANLAMGGLNDEIEAETARRRKRHKGGALKRIRLSRPQHLQRLVLAASTFFFDALLEHARGAEQRRGLHVFYLKLLIEQALGHGSFEANVAMNGLLYGCSAAEILLFQDFATDEQHQRSDSQVGKRRQAILKMVEQHLGQWVRRESGSSGQARLVVDESVAPQALAEMLAALVPWDGKCDLPPDVGRQRKVPRRLWPRVNDLHSGAMASSREEDPRHEINRIYALVEPEIHKLLAGMLGIGGSAQAPKLFRPEGENLAEDPRA